MTPAAAPASAGPPGTHRSVAKAVAPGSRGGGQQVAKGRQAQGGSGRGGGCNGRGGCCPLGGPGGHQGANRPGGAAGGGPGQSVSSTRGSAAEALPPAAPAPCTADRPADRLRGPQSNSRIGSGLVRSNCFHHPTIKVNIIAVFVLNYYYYILCVEWEREYSGTRTVSCHLH